MRFVKRDAPDEMGKGAIMRAQCCAGGEFVRRLLAFVWIVCVKICMLWFVML